MLLLEVVAEDDGVVQGQGQLQDAGDILMQNKNLSPRDTAMERKPNAASDQTKHALAQALKELMAQKPIEKITIHDLAERCGIRRQNFYYHFEDVYDLLRWMFQEEEVALMTHIQVVSYAAILESWLLGEIDRTPEELIAFADQMLQDHIQGARLRWSAARPTP